MLEIVRFWQGVRSDILAKLQYGEQAMTLDFNAPLAGVNLLQVVTLALALLGAALGLINTWASLDKSRIKLRVRPAHAIPVGGAPQHIGLSITITNLSAFPVTVNEVGLLLRGTNKRAAIVTPILADGGVWPRRLEARSSVTLYAERPSQGQNRITCAYATTECGVTRKGNSPALKQMSRED
jgi:hypothetical protein